MKMRNRTLSLAIALVVLTSLLISGMSFAAPKWGEGGKMPGPPAHVIEKFQLKAELKIQFENKWVKFDTPPVIKAGRTLIPVRAITEAMGAEVDWDADDYIVTITGEHAVTGETIVIKFFLKAEGDEPRVTIDDEDATEQLYGEAGLINNRTYVPLRFIAEVLGLKVGYDDGNIDIQGLPKIAPTKLNLDAEMTTAAAISVILKGGYAFEEIEELSDALYEYIEAENKVYIDEDAFDGIDVVKNVLTFVFDHATETDEKRELEVNLLYNMPTVEDDEEFVGTDFVVEVDEKEYTFASLWLKKGSTVTEIDEDFYDFDSVDDELTIFDEYFEDELEVEDEDVVTVILRFEMTDEDDVDVTLEIPVEL